MEMKKSVRLALAMVMIAAIMSFTFGCAKQATQAQSPDLQDTPAAQVPKPVEPARDSQATPAPEKRELSTIRFDFDSAVLSDQAQQMLVSNAGLLRSNHSVLVTIEGHCDERGTAAYNIALGERRAKAVQEFLVSMGISASRLSTVSYGEEKPIATGHNEDAWAQNRRAQFMVN
jgi:peptidoglycan-associated lipoprotein